MTIRVPHGFRLAGLYSGVKRNPTREDLALVVSDAPAVAAGVYTKNLVYAAPVALDRGERPAAAFARWRSTPAMPMPAPAIVVWPTPWKWPAWPRRPAGPMGEQALVMSTGMIGEFLPLEKICAGLEQSPSKLARDETSLIAAARGMMTTDTVHKLSGRSLSLADDDADHRHGQRGRDDWAPDGDDALPGDDRRPADARDCPAGSLRRDGRHVQLHQRRRAHEHQRHGVARWPTAPPAARRWNGPISTRFKKRCTRCAANWPARFRPTAKGRRTWFRSK